MGLVWRLGVATTATALQILKFIMEAEPERREWRHPSPTCAQVAGTSAFLGYSAWGGAGVVAGLRAGQRGCGDYTGDMRYQATSLLWRSAFAWTPTARIRRIRTQAGHSDCAADLESETAARWGSRKRGGCARRVSSCRRFAPRTIVSCCYLYRRCETSQ